MTLLYIEKQTLESLTSGQGLSDRRPTSSCGLRDLGVSPGSVIGSVMKRVFGDFTKKYDVKPQNISIYIYIS